MNFIDAVKKLENRSTRAIIRQEYNDHPSRAVYMINNTIFNAYLGKYDDSLCSFNIECVLAEDWLIDNGNKLRSYIRCKDGVHIESFYINEPKERFSCLNLMISDEWITDRIDTMPTFSEMSVIGKEFKFNVGAIVSFNIDKFHIKKMKYQISEITTEGTYVLVSILLQIKFTMQQEYVEDFGTLEEENTGIGLANVIYKLKQTTNYRAKHADKIIRYSHWSDQLYICSDQKVDYPVEESFYYPTTEEILSDKWELLMIEEPKLYSFKKAIKHFMDGYSIKRYSWNNFINKDNTDEYEDIFSVKDIQANDWEINGN
jgi:hypothetical protein